MKLCYLWCLGGLLTCMNAYTSAATLTTAPTVVWPGDISVSANVAGPVDLTCAHAGDGQPYLAQNSSTLRIVTYRPSMLHARPKQKRKSSYKQGSISRVCLALCLNHR